MAQQTIDIAFRAGSNSDSLPQAFDKANDNFTELYGAQIAPLNTTIGIYNPSAILKTRTALAKVLGVSAQMKIAFVGDSVTAGTTASGVDYLFASSYAYRIAAMLAARGIACRTDAALGGHSTSINSPATYATYDPRVSMGANLSPLSSFASYGFCAFHDATGAANAASTWTFTPAGAFDRIDVYYFSNPGWGSGAVNVNGGATAGTFSCNQALGLRKLAISVSRESGGNDTINIVCTGDTYFLGVHAYDSTVPAVNCFNFGINGASSVTYGNSALYPWDPGTTGSLAVFAPDLTFIFLGLNDCSAQTAAATYLSNIQYYITEAKSTGDCILVGLWGTTNDAGDTFRAAYTAALKSLAVTNGVALIDTYPLYGTSANSITLGLTDGLHPTHAGQADMANVVANLLTGLV